MFGLWWSGGRGWGRGARFSNFPWRGISLAWNWYLNSYASCPYYGSFGSYPY